MGDGPTGDVTARPRRVHVGAVQLTIAGPAGPVVGFMLGSYGVHVGFMLGSGKGYLGDRPGEVRSTCCRCQTQFTLPYMHALEVHRPLCHRIPVNAQNSRSTLPAKLESIIMITTNIICSCGSHLRRESRVPSPPCPSYCCPRSAGAVAAPVLAWHPGSWCSLPPSHHC